MGRMAELRKMGGAAAAESVARPTVGIFPGERSAAAVDDRPERLKGLKAFKDAQRIAMDRIVGDPDQPRKEFDHDELERLASSLQRHGQLQLIAVRWSEDLKKYVVKWGERRFRAAQLLGWPTIGAVIEDEGPDGAMGRLERQLIENCVRQDLRPIEEARAFKSLMDAGGLTGDQLGRLLSISPGKVSKALKLLELPEPVQDLVERGELSPGTAYEVAKAKDPRAVAMLAVEEKLTREQVAALVKPATSLPLFGVYIAGSAVPNMFVAAVSQADAEGIAYTHMFPGTRHEVYPWLNELPKGYQAVQNTALVPHLGTQRRPDLIGQLKHPAIIPAEERPEVAPFDETTPAIAAARPKVETLDDTQTYHLGQGVMIVIEGPRAMIAEPATWLDLLVDAIDEGRVDARGHVIPRSSQPKTKKKGIGR